MLFSYFHTFSFILDWDGLVHTLYITTPNAEKERKEESPHTRTHSVFHQAMAKIIPCLGKKELSREH